MFSIQISKILRTDQALDGPSKVICEVLVRAVTQRERNSTRKVTYQY